VQWITLLHPILTTREPKGSMSFSRSITVEPKGRKKRVGSGLWGLFGNKKRSSRILSSNSSPSLHSSEGGSIQKHGHKPSITIDESTLPVFEAADASALSHPQVLLQAPDAQRRQSLISDKSKGNIASSCISPHNE
jgi:hypothetical protein